MMSKEALMKSAKLHSYKPEMLEKVLILIDVLGQFAAVPFLNEHLALKGGTALNLFHFEKIPRLSVDIDLNYIGSADQNIMKKERKIINGALFKIMQQNNFDLERSPNHYAGGKMIWRYPSALGQKGNLEIDLNYMYRKPLWPIQHIESKLTIEKSAAIPVLDIHELSAGKLAALFDRQASRDLFDARYLLTHCDLNRKKLRLSFVIYLAISTVELKNIKPDYINYDLRDLQNRLLPVLHQEKIPKAKSDVKNFAQTLLNELHEKLSEILPLTDAENEFIKKIRTDGIIDPALITNDEKLSEILESHPAILWAAKRNGPPADPLNRNRISRFS